MPFPSRIASRVRRSASEYAKIGSITDRAGNANGRPTMTNELELPQLPATAIRRAKPAVRVQLPIKAKARFGVAVLLVLVASVCALGVSSALFRSEPSIVAAVVAWVVMIVGLCGLLSVQLHWLDCNGDALVLTLDRTELFDRRVLGGALAWNEIARVTVLYGGQFGDVCEAVRLQVRQEISVRHNPFRLGVVTTAWRRRPDEVIIPLVCLDCKADLLARAISRLVELNGGEVVTR